MLRLLYLLLVSVFLLDYLALKLHVISKYVAWLPELITIAITVVVMLRVGRTGFAARKLYAILVPVLLVSIFIGVVLNTVPAGTLIAGIRTYLKFLPVLVLPLVYRFDEKDLRRLAMLVLLLGLIQAPLAVYQRLFQFKGIITGDVVTGTASSSGLLSIILFCMIAMVVSFYVRERIRFHVTLVLCFLLLAPATINGTKGSVILLPIAVMMPILLASKWGSWRKLIPVAVIMAIMAVILLQIADSVYDRKNLDAGVLDFFTREGRLESYLYRGVDADDRIEQIGRIDSYFLAFMVLSKDPWNLTFGLGISNVSGSAISSLNGEYYAQYERYGPRVTAFTQFLWETGVVGVTLYIMLLLAVLKDSLLLRRSEGFIGAFAHGWAVVTFLMIISLLYKNVMNENIIIYCYWLFSGIVIAESYRFRMSQKQVSEQPKATLPQLRTAKIDGQQ